MNNNEKIAEIKRALALQDSLVENHEEIKSNINDDVRYLLSELERVKEMGMLLADRNVELADENNMLREERKQLICVLPSEMADRDRREQKLIEVLRFYADEATHGDIYDEVVPILDDSGQRAREILVKLGVTEE